MSAGQPAGMSGLRVVIVEDDASDAELISIALASTGETTIDIVDRKEDLERRLAAGPVDLVISDYGLPGWDGLTALDLVRRACGDVPFILVTGSLGDERAVECLLQGMDDYVLKTNLARLPSAVSRAIEKRRIRVEKELTVAAIRKLSYAVDQSPASVMITDTKGRIEYVNRRFTEITGYEFSEAVGRTPRIIQSGLTPVDTYRTLWAAILRGETWRSEIRNRRKDGELYWGAIVIAPLRDESGAITHFIGTQQDITTQIDQERIARERERRFRQVVGNMREVFFVIDAGLRELLYINASYEAVWGRSVPSAYERPQSMFDAIVEADRARLLDAIELARAGERPIEVEFRILRPDGEVHWALASAAAIRDDAGKVIQLSGVVLDITERRRAQHALAESESRSRSLIDASFDGIAIVVGGIVVDVNDGALRLFGYSREELVGRPATDLVATESRPAVAERIASDVSGTFDFVGVRKDGGRIIVESTTRMHHAGGHAERITAMRDVTVARRTEAQIRQAQKMEAIGSLAGGVAHDFNNLLTVITTYASFIEDSLTTDDPRHGDVAEITKAAGAAATLTRQLLAFSRQQVIEPRVIVLNEIVASAERMLARVIGEDVSISARCPADPVFVRVDPGQIEQVIMNLAVNARDAMPAGGKLTIELAETYLDDEYAKRHLALAIGPFAVMAVSDNGIGMDAQIQARIFEPFFTTKPIGKGTGLGLSTVYGIVKQNGGFVWVYSEPGHGSTFKVYLPIATEGPASSSGEQPRELPAGSESILVVEDSTTVRAATRGLLERFGYSVIDVPSGTAALQVARDRTTRIDLLVTDVVMPDMGGRQVADAFSEIRPATKILYVSGYADDAIVRHGILSAGAAFLQKPFSPEALARKVRQLLDS